MISTSGEDHRRRCLRRLDRSSDVPRLRDNPEGQGPPGRSDRDAAHLRYLWRQPPLKACYALDTAWGTYVPPNATRVRNIAQACETFAEHPALVLRDHGSGPDGIPIRGAPSLRGGGADSHRTSARAIRPASTLSQLPVEVYAIFGGQWPHSSFMIPGGVMSAPTLSDVTRSISILEHWGESGWRAVARLFRGPLAREQELGRHPRLDG